MCDLVQQFHRCLTFFRNKEIECDFQSTYGEPVVHTSLRSIEKSVVSNYTNEVFNLFTTLVKKSTLLRVTKSQEMSSGCIYKVTSIVVMVMNGSLHILNIQINKVSLNEISWTAL